MDRTEYLGYDNMYGDVVFATEYNGYADQNGIKMPASRMDFEYGKAERQVTYKPFRSYIKPDTADLKITLVPKYFKKKMAERIEIRDNLIFENIASNISIIKIVSQNNKRLVAEFPNNIALFETPSGIELNENIIEQLKKRYLGKPLKFLFVTHHHPDHAGGLRAYAALPLTIVTTTGNQTYFEEIMKKSQTMSNVLTDNTQNFRFDFVPLNGEKSFMGNVVAY